MKKIAILMATAFIAVSCSNGTKADEAVTGEAQEVEAMTEAADYELVEGSYLKWRGFKSYVASEHIGTIGVQEGTFSVAGDQLVGGTITIDMNSISNDDIEDEGKRGYLEGHLKSDDFFSVEKFNESSLTILSSSKNDSGLDVNGSLTIKGITLPIKFKLEDLEMDQEEVRWKGVLTFDRSKYNVRFRSGSFFQNLGDKLILDEIRIETLLDFY